MAFALPNINAKTDVSSKASQTGDLLETSSGAKATGPTFNVNKSALPAWAPWAGLALGVLAVLKYGRKLWAS